MNTVAGLTSLPLVNWKRLQSVLTSQDVDLVVATTNVNVTYLSDFWSLSQWSRRTAQIFAVAGRTAERDVDVILSLGAADLLALPSRVAPTRIWTYGDFYCAGLERDGLPPDERAFRDAFVSANRHKTPIDALVAAIEARGASRSRIALEAGGLADGAWSAIAAMLPNAQFLSAEALFRSVRALKSRREIDLLRQSAQLTD
jgi:Xaa-Pro aminopeptidase